jgi:hypothetical protein
MVFPDLTKEQQLNYTNFLLNHYMEQRRIIASYRSATSDPDRVILQAALDAKVAEDITVDGWLATLP